MSFFEVAILIISGIIVGFVNTLAGGGTVISLGVMVFLGLPVHVANGTHRIAAFFQTMVSAASFKRQNHLDVKKGFVLGVPVIAGSVLGARIAVDIDEELFKRLVALMMLIMLFFMYYKPGKWLKGQEQISRKPISFFQWVIFFVIGFYGGLIHIGVGYFLLAGIVLAAGYNLVKGNALKVFMVFLYVPFALLVFMLNDQVNYSYGLVHAIGNVLGALIGARFAVRWGVKAVRLIMTIIIFMIAAHFMNFLTLVG